MSSEQIDTSNIRLGIYLGRHAAFAGGIGVYASSLIDNYLSMLAEGKIKLKALVVYGDSSLLSVGARETFFKESWPYCELKFCELSVPKSRVCGYFIDQLRLPEKFQDDRISIVHCLANIGFLRPVPFQVVTIHDLYQGWPVVDCVDQKSWRDFAKHLKSIFYKTIFRLQARSLVMVLTDARQVATEVLKFLPIRDSSMPRVVPLGLDDTFVNAPLPFETSGSADCLCKDGFVLLNYSQDPRKNISRSFAAWRALPADLRARGLVILGADGNQDAIKSLLQESFDSSVHLSSHVAREKLPELLARAGALLVPTLAEGFGFPVIESVSMNTPVVTGRLECLEGLQDRLIYVVDPRSIDSIRQGLEDALACGVVDGHRAKIRTMRDAAQETFDLICRSYLN